MSGGKGGSTSSTVEIPQYIEDAAKRNLARADTISQIGYVPYYGADVAAFTPMQEAAFRNTAGTAGAFGLAGGDMSQQDITGGMPAPTTYAGGVRGYSSVPMYEQAMDELATRRPGQKSLIDSLFIDPYSGVAGANVGPMVDYTDTRTPGDLGGGSVGGGGDGGSVYFPETIRGTPTAPTDGTVYTSTDFAGNEVPYTIVTPTDVRPPGYIDNTPSTFPEQRQYYDSSPMLPGGPAIMHSSDGTSTNLGYDLGPSVAGGRGTIVPGQPTYAAQPTQEQLDYAATSLDPFGGAGPDVTSGPISGLVSGGGADGVGNFGKVGDFFGGLLGGLNVTGPPVENKVTSYSHATSNESNASQLAEAAARQSELQRLASALDTREKLSAYTNSESANFDAPTIRAAQLSRGGTGIVYKDDRREVYLDGVLIGNPKSAESADKMLAKAKAAKEAARTPPPPPQVIIN